MLKKMSKADTFRKTHGYLLDNENAEYLQMFPNPEELFKSVPKVRKRRELWTLSSHKEFINSVDNEFMKKDEYFLDADEYYKWYYEYEEQPRHYVSVSKKSSLLCELLKHKSLQSVKGSHEPVVPISSVKEEAVIDMEVDDDFFMDFENFDDVNVKVIKDDKKNSIQLEELPPFPNECLDVNANPTVLDKILEDDPYSKLYTDEFPDPPSADVINGLIKALRPKERLVKIDLKEALRSFRKKMSRSSSPIFFSQSQITTEKRETSTPAANAKKGKVLKEVTYVRITKINSTNFIFRQLQR